MTSTPVASTEVDEFLAHYGVLGMHWGQRKAEIPGVSNKTSKQAKKDAVEFAKAKMFYGEGAGTRRKLIKAKVNSKAAKDPAYKKAFDHHLAAQDLGKRASQARSERARKDTTKAVGKTARGVKNLALGTGASVTISALAVYAAAKNPAVRAFVGKNATKTFNSIKDSAIVNEMKLRFAKNASDNGNLWAS